jgi:hypothetical protein
MHVLIVKLWGQWFLSRNDCRKKARLALTFRQRARYQIRKQKKVYESNRINKQGQGKGNVKMKEKDKIAWPAPPSRLSLGRSSLVNVKTIKRTGAKGLKCRKRNIKPRALRGLTLKCTFLHTSPWTASDYLHFLCGKLLLGILENPNSSPTFLLSAASLASSSFRFSSSCFFFSA